MMPRQAARMFGMSAGNRQHFEAHSRNRGDDRPVEAQFADGSLDCYLPDAGSTHEDLVRRIDERGAQLSGDCVRPLVGPWSRHGNRARRKNKKARREGTQNWA